MAKHRHKPLGKTRTRDHVIADLAINHVERQVLLCGYTLERIVHDYGLDLILFTFDTNGEPESGDVLLQVKATEQLETTPSTGAFHFRIGRADLVNWLSQLLPVILIVYDAVRDQAYWLYVQAYFARQAGFNLFEAAETITVRISPLRGLDSDAVRRFGDYRDRIYLQLPARVVHED